MLIDELPDERTQRDDLPSFGLDIIKSELRKGVAHPMTFKFGFDLGVDEEVSPAPHVINAEAGDFAVDLDYVSIVFGIVVNDDFEFGGLSHVLPDKIQRPQLNTRLGRPLRLDPTHA